MGKIQTLTIDDDQNTTLIAHHIVCLSREGDEVIIRMTHGYETTLRCEDADEAEEQLVEIRDWLQGCRR